MIDLGTLLLHVCTSDKRLMVPGHSWRRFFLLFGMFFAALVLADLLPLSNWSDVQSKWLNEVAAAIVCVGFLITVVWTYRKGDALTLFQTSLLCMIFGFALFYTARQLYADVLFQREGRGRQSSADIRMPNPYRYRSAADAVLGFHLRSGINGPAVTD